MFPDGSHHYPGLLHDKSCRRTPVRGLYKSGHVTELRPHMLRHSSPIHPIRTSHHQLRSIIKKLHIMLLTERQHYYFFFTNRPNLFLALSLEAAILECTKLRQRRENTHNVISHMTRITKHSVVMEKSDCAEFTRMPV